MYILYHSTGPDQWQAVGYFCEFQQAVCALEEELKKNDGGALKIEKDGYHDALRENT